MPSSLLPEKSLVISPSLAATIGLEEAVMLQGLHERMRYSKAEISKGFKWYQFDQAQLQDSFPFWQPGDVQRIAKSLADKGILVISDDYSYLSQQTLKLALNEKVVSAVENNPSPAPSSSPRPTPSTPATTKKPGGGAQKMSAQWQPDPQIQAQIKKYGIPASFIKEVLPEFISYWTERGEAHHSWSSKFLKWTVRRWREEETVFAAQQKAGELAENWCPNEDALEILTRAGIQESFIQDAIPEFILYWRERGDNSSTWNSKFVQHVRRQWARYCQALEYDTEPRPIPANWQPSQDVYDILQMANIDGAFAKSLVPEFVVFWRDSNKLYSSWNSKFLQHVKYHWARRHQMPVAGQARTADQDFVELHTDSSWREGL